jgi:Zn-dependent peptidase ImmA (M78 family)
MKEIVKIGRYKWRILFKKYVGECKTHYDAGECDYDKRKISIQSGQTKAAEANTILHEILHAICHDQKLGLKYDLEEEVVTGIANGLQDFIRDNPKYALKLARSLKAT